MEHMLSIERTKEFNLIIQRYKTKAQFSPSNNLFKTRNSKIHTNVNIESFKNVAKYLSNMLQQTESKLYQLEVFLNSDVSSYLRDRPKIDSLTDVIMSDLNDLTKLFTQMQELLKLTNSKLPFNVQKRAHLSSIALHIQKRFQDLSKNFKDCIKKKEYFNKPNQKTGFNLVTEEISVEKYPQENNYNYQIDSQCQISNSVKENELRQREKSVKDVEATIVQLGDVFEQFSSVVQEQEELVQGILCHSSSAFLDIEEAHSQLTKYLNTVKSHRSLMLRVFGILIVLILIFTYLL